MAAEELDPEQIAAQKALDARYHRLNRQEYYDKIIRELTGSLVVEVMSSPRDALPSGIRKVRLQIEKAMAEAAKEGV